MKQNYQHIVFSEVPAFVRSAINEILDREGLYSNDTEDHETKYGLRKLSLDEAGYAGEIKELTRDDAARIWVNDYWYKPRFNLIHEISPLTAKTVLDTAGVIGRVIAIQHLQAALTSFNAIGKNGPIYGPDLIMDGAMGAKTADQLRKYLNHRKNDYGERKLAALLNSLQAARFVDVAVRLPHKRKYGYGWTSSRVFADLIDIASGDVVIA